MMSEGAIENSRVSMSSHVRLSRAGDERGHDRERVRDECLAHDTGHSDHWSNCLRRYAALTRSGALASRFLLAGLSSDSSV